MKRTNYVRIGGTEYEAQHINARNHDNRYNAASVDVRLAMAYGEAKALFTEPGNWFAVSRFNGAPNPLEEVVDLTAYEILCNIVDTMDGYTVVTMRKASYSEILTVLLGN